MKLPRLCFFLTALVWLPVFLEAQVSELLQIRDTSYFKPGNDEWNLVESVIRSDHSNIYFLLNRGADPDARAEGGMSALMYAAESGDTLSVSLLILNGASLEYTEVENTTPVMVAVLNQQFRAAHLLLRSGANPNAVDTYGASPLLYAAALNDYEMADLLLFYGADDSFRDKDGNGALMTAATLAHLETADILLQNGVAPDEKDRMSNTPLMVAAQQGDTALAGLLLEYGAALEAVNEDNFTPLSHAVRTGKLTMVAMLADSGANIHHQITRNQNLFDLSRQIQAKEISQFLEERGAGPSPRPDFSELRLSWGNSFGNDEYLMQVRFAWLDSKFGLFAETGMDFRPTFRIRQVRENDTLVYQYREQRWVWTHGLGKEFKLFSDHSGIVYGAYAGVYGMLSSPVYRGFEGLQSLHYNLALGAGLNMKGEIAGIKAGAERYSFGTLLEGKWKMNISIYLRIPYKQSYYHVKEISY